MHNCLRSLPLLLAVFLLSSAACQAQQQWQTQGQTQGQSQAYVDKPIPGWPPPRKSGPSERNKFFAAKQLDREPELPGFPKYSGKTKLIKAFRFPSNNGAETWNLRYYVKDDAAAVRDWYYGAFHSSGWEMPPANNTNNSIMAIDRRNGVQVQVTTHRSGAGGYRSEMYVRYITYPKKQQH